MLTADGPALEDCELFNAGTGSRIQADGEIRMSAALMDGVNNTFSGVINLQYVKNPILDGGGTGRRGAMRCWPA